MCASESIAERVRQRAQSKPRQLEEEAEMESKGKKRSRQEEEDTSPGHARKRRKRKKRPRSGKEDKSPEPSKKNAKGKETQPQEEDTGPEPAGPSRGPGQAGPSDEDYNIPTSERTKLLTKLKKNLKIDLVSPTFWACCQLSDIETLKVLVGTAKMNPRIVLAVDNDIALVPKLWTQRLGNSSGSVSGASTNNDPGKSTKTKENSDGKKWVGRSKGARELCRERDREECVLTRSMDPQVTHIFPYSMLNRPANTPHLRGIAQAGFWRLLRVFWDNDHVDKWKNKIFPDPQHPDTGVESCFNLICLAGHAHTHWNNGRFALKPLELSGDKKKLTVQFFWQPQYDHQFSDHVDLLKKPLSSKGLNLIKKQDKACFLNRLMKDESTRKIQSGEIFTLTTNDPESKPLPSWELLEMQWILQRITAMSGAAEAPEFDFDDDDDIDYRPALIPDDNNRDIRFYFNRVYKWIQPPPFVPSMAKQAIEVQCEPNQENPKVLAKDMPRQVVNVS